MRRHNILVLRLSNIDCGIQVKLSNGQLVDLIPWFLRNTAKRHHQWKGLLGRLDWEGNFPISITDPQPMGIVGMCFHPDQDRILSVRECARSQVNNLATLTTSNMHFSVTWAIIFIIIIKLIDRCILSTQGFPDSYKYVGNVYQKHRQIGNAVPPPLAYALGTKLKEAIAQKISN